MKFADLNLGPALHRAMEKKGLKTCTTIQEKAFSSVMSGENILGIAQTGTGKTLAYLMPLLRLFKFNKSKSPQILILVPTRELVLQVSTEIEVLTEQTDLVVQGIYGGTNINTQITALLPGVDVLVATPGRLFDLMVKQVFKTTDLKKVVIDEVDEMLSLGFRTQLNNVMGMLPLKKQVLMFSATMTKDVEHFIGKQLKYYKKIEAARTGTPLSKITQQAITVPNFYTKVNVLIELLSREEFQKVLVFVSSKRMAQRLLDELDPEEARYGIIHSNKSQNNRFSTLKAFEEGKITALVATDLVARGIDVSEVSHVINFDIPEISEHYMHRIGRTGRAGHSGVAISLVSERDEPFFLSVESLMGLTIERQSISEGIEISNELIPEEMPEVKMPNMERKVRKNINPDSGPAFHDKKEKNKKVNQKITRAQAMKMKYKKPKTRGQKRK